MTIGKGPKGIVAASLMAFSFAVSAAPFFNDDFDASAGGLNVVPTGWTVSNGTVDVVGGGFCVAGQCVDLDGSTQDAGVLSRSFNLTGGITYILSFDLSGNRRGGIDDVLVSFGTASQFFDDLPSGSPYTNYSLVFTPGSDGIYSVSFDNTGGDNVGAVLDNVVITTRDATTDVPEPASLGLLGLGLAALAVSRRRNR